MPYPAPTLESLIRSQEALFEAALVRHAATRGLQVTPDAIMRSVRSPRGTISAMVRNNAAMLWAAHQHLGWNGRQVLPHTADADIMVEHADVWGISRRPATRAIGRLVFAGAPSLAVPEALEFRTRTGAIVATTEPISLDATGVGSAPVRALVAGSEGNTAAGETLSLVVGLSGLDPASGVVDADGLAGGAALETDASLLGRVLDRIRQPPHGGAIFDYPVWVRNAFAASHVAGLPNWVGLGTIGVAVAMGTRSAPRAPTPEEQAAILAYLGPLGSQAGVRPATADVVVLGAEIAPLDLDLTIEPDTLAVREAVTAAFAAFMVRESEIGGTIWRSRLSEALSSAAGEYRHTLSSPPANVDASPLRLYVPGTITWGTP